MQYQTRNPFAALPAGLLFLATVLLPPLGMAYGAGSMAAGVFLVAGMYVCLFALFSILYRPPKTLGKIALIVTIVLVLILSQGLLNYWTNSTFNVDRFWLTYAGLILFIAGALCMASVTQKLSARKAHFALKFVFYVLLLSVAGRIFGYSPFYGIGASVLFFSENAHYALSISPLFMYMAVVSRLRSKWFFIFIGIAIALFLQSFTLLIGVGGIAFVAFRLRQLVLLALLGVAILWIGIDYIDTEYFTSRMVLLNENADTSTAKLSTLAYRNGWERAYLNLKDYHGLGIGFQQLGFVGSEGEASGELMALDAQGISLTDGSFVAAKLISEFGIFALASLLIYLVYFIKTAIWLREVSVNGRPGYDCKDVFFRACFAMFFVDLFIRGTGYFSASGFLFVASLAWFALNRLPDSELQRSGHRRNRPVPLESKCALV
jgi:hypothetical protein